MMVSNWNLPHGIIVSTDHSNQCMLSIIQITTRTFRRSVRVNLSGPHWLAVQSLITMCPTYSTYIPSIGVIPGSGNCKEITSALDLLSLFRLS